MSLLFLFLFLFTFKFCTSINQQTLITHNNEDWKIYEQWLVEHHKSYNSEEKHRRFKIFQATLRTIHHHNSRNDSGDYKLGLNQFSDLSQSEFEANSLCSAPSGLQDFTMLPYEPTVDIRPNYVNWTALNAISPIKNQGQCGSCWAFSAVASVESLNFLVTGRLTQLSEQELIDCDPHSFGCKGGSAWSGIRFIKENGGINSAEAYPYTGVTGTCDEAKIRAKVASIVDYAVVTPNNTFALMNTVANYPAVSVRVDATGAPFRNYRSGIFRGPCGINLTHAVNIVGYGTERGTDYWIVRNSWGTRWGEQGYMRIRRDVADGYQPGLCGIAIFPVIPLKSLI